MSSSSSSLLVLQEEYNIPKNATIHIKNNKKNDKNTTTTTNKKNNYAFLSCSEGDIEIGPQSSKMEYNFLLVGRQAAIADIRIDHKSISRKHAILYYCYTNTNNDDTTTTTTTTTKAEYNNNNDNNHRQSSSSSSSLVLYIKDLKTKKQTKVNNKSIPFDQPTILYPNDKIQFGTAKPTFQLKWKQQQQQQQKQIDKKDIEETKNKTTTTTNEKDVTDSTIQEQEQQQQQQQMVEEAGAGLTGRAKREAEIAAMMKSLEETPMYNKFMNTTTDNDTNIVNGDDNNNNNDNDDDNNNKNINNNNNNNQLLLLKNEMKRIKNYRIPIQDSISIKIQPPQDEVSWSSNKTIKKIKITCLALDPSGARFAIGCTDQYLRLYDFAGMRSSNNNNSTNNNILPFCTLLVQDGYRIIDACYSNNGDRLIVATGSIQPKILDRDGNEILQLVRGDVYIRDPTKTVGHTASITCVKWHPLLKDIIITSSLDGSVRIWDIKNGKLQFQQLTCTTILPIKGLSGKKTSVTTFTIGNDGRNIAIGTECGCIQLWNINKSKLRPQKIFSATTTTTNNNTIQHPLTSLIYNVDGKYLASRTKDGICHVWNTGIITSKLSSPILTYQINNESSVVGKDSSSTSSRSTNSPRNEDDNNNDDDDISSMTTMFFSPNGEILCIGCPSSSSSSSSKEESSSKLLYPTLKFFSISNATTKAAAAVIDSSSTSKTKNQQTKPILEYPITIEDCTTSTTITSTTIRTIQWHSKLNQIFVIPTGISKTSDSMNQMLHILFHDRYSKNGALLVTGGHGGSYSTSTSTHRKKRHRNNNNNNGGGGEDELQQLYQSRAPPPGSSMIVRRQSDIVTPNSLPLFQDESQKHNRNNNKKKKKHHHHLDNTIDSNDPLNKAPQPPAKGIHIGGQSSTNSTFTQFIVDSTTKTQKAIAGRDPREALFQYQKGKSYISDAYKGNKEVILADKTVEQDEEEQQQEKK